MISGAWLEVLSSPADQACRVRFVEIMHLMDARYKGMTDSQLANWLDPAVSPYQNEAAHVYAWFPTGSDKKTPAAMELVLLCHYDKAKNRAWWLTCGWAAPNNGYGTEPGKGLTIDTLNDVLDRIVTQLAAWMQSRTPSNPTNGVIYALLPFTMDAQFMGKLYSTGHWSAIWGERRGDFTVSIGREHSLQDSVLLELKVTAAP